MFIRVHPWQKSEAQPASDDGAGFVEAELGVGGKDLGAGAVAELLAQGGDLWRQVKDRLQSPVRKLRRVQRGLEDRLAPRAGESALAHYTMLAAPRVERRAVAATRWKELAPQLDGGAAFDFAGAVTELETWSYDPAPLAQGGVVDRLSLYLSVRDDPDERVAQAAEQLLEPFGW